MLQHNARMIVRILFGTVYGLTQSTPLTMDEAKELAFRRVRSVLSGLDLSDELLNAEWSKVVDEVANTDD